MLSKQERHPLLICNSLLFLPNSNSSIIYIRLGREHRKEEKTLRGKFLPYFDMDILHLYIQLRMGLADLL